MRPDFHRILHSNFSIPILFILFFLAACSAPVAPSPTPSVRPPDTQQAATPTALQSEPTPTTAPLAVQVNDDGVPLVDYQIGLKQLQAAQAGSKNPAPPQDQRQQILDDLIDQSLLAQAAYQGGFQIDQKSLQARIDQLAQKMGGAGALAQWQTGQGYTAETFQDSLKRGIAANWQRDQVFATVPADADQVHVRQIIVYNKADADKALSRLIPGIDFATLAYQYDPVTGGDLGWFPRGYLTEPAVEAAAFTLQPGQVSEVIEGNVGFHIIEVIERDPKRALSPDARLRLQKNALQDWLKTRREQSKITVLAP